jgi:hypothetical protein
MRVRLARSRRASEFPRLSLSNDDEALELRARVRFTHRSVLVGQARLLDPANAGHMPGTKPAGTISGVPTVLIQCVVKIKIQEMRVPPAFLTYNAARRDADSFCSVDPASIGWMHGRP